MISVRNDLIKQAAKIKDKLLDEIKVYLVDGNEVRNKHNIDFTIGGHYYRYDFIPENEIWIENDISVKSDLIADLCHEYVERTLMKHLKIDYDTAHNIANRAEKAIRTDKKLSKRAFERGDRYWLDPYGKLYNTGHSHHTFIETHPEIFGKFEDSNKESIYDLAFDIGWSRIIVHSKSIIVNPPDTTDKYVKLIQNALHLFPMKPIIRYVPQNNPAISVDLRRQYFMDANGWDDLFETYKMLKRFSSISKRASGLECYWLNSDGKLYDAKGDHVKFILSHPEIFGTIDEKENPYPYDAAFKRGWTRIVVFVDIYINPPNTDTKYLILSQNALKNLPRKEYVLYAPETILHEALRLKRQYFMEASSWDDLLATHKMITQYASISKRAAVQERAGNIGISVRVRKEWRKHYSGMPNIALLRNDVLNKMIAQDFKSSEILHRFLLKSAEIGEFRKSHNGWIYLAVYRNGNYDVISTQPSIKPVHPEVAKQRITQDWLDRGWKDLLESKTKPRKSKV